MGLKELRAEIDDEISTLLGSDFAIEVTKTQTVPHAADGAITFPDITRKTQGTKLITTCVLYVDIRRSTELNFSHKGPTVAKLYTAFVRAMTQVARHHDGHVRGIIGDRVMVIFDSAKCFTNAVNCAIAMNTVCQDIINKRFKANEVTCGIGIDAGNMLATKTGIRRHGVEQANYRNLVWLGRPANIASKLTDLANKPAEWELEKIVSAAYEEPDYLSALFPEPSFLGGIFGGYPSEGVGGPPAPRTWGTLGNALGYPSQGSLSGLGMFNALAPPAPPPSPSPRWQWKDETFESFLSNVQVEYEPSRRVIVHNDPNFRTFILSARRREVRGPTPPILMTATVWKGFRSEQPNDPCIKKGLFNRVHVNTPGYDGAVFGGDVIFPGLKE
jgi:adenylate cyclase